MENENVGEQPEKEIENTQETGSPYGKFVNLSDLKNAYENLEKEFTRKSQLLKEFQKNADQQQNQTNNFENEKLPPAEDTEKMVADEKTDNVVDMPCWQREDWQTQVQDFLNENPLAKNYATQISQTVLEDKEILQSKNPLWRAWAKWLEANFKTPEQLLEDPSFLDKLKQNKSLRREIVKDYLSELNNKPKAPPLFAAASSVGPTENTKDLPKTLEEAKEWAKKIFDN